MFALLVSWLIVIIVFCSFGNAVVFIYNRIAGRQESYSFLDTFLLGMCFSTILIMILSFWLPSGSNVLILLLFLSGGYWLLRRKRLNVILRKSVSRVCQTPKLYFILICIAVLSVLLHSVLAPMWVDTSYYHIQNIMWNDQYHIVPGLANLQPRFGFNSNYYLLCSVFGLKPLFGQYIFGVHTLCIALIFCWLIYKSLKSKMLVPSVIALFIFCLFLFVYKLHITSPSSDLLPNLLILYLSLKIVFDKDALKNSPLLFFLLPVFCLTLKLSSFVVCLFAAYVFWMCLKEKSYKQFSFLVVYALLIVGIWCARTVIITGYLVFPYPAIDIFSFDWKVPVQYVIDQKDYIQSFARVDNIPMQEALAMNITEWLPMWWKVGMFYYFPIANRVLFILGLLSVPLMLFLFFILKTKRERYYSVFGAWVVALGGFIFWLFSAPDFRFAYGFILPFAFFPAIIISSMLEDRLSLQQNTIRKLCIAAGVLAVLFAGSQSVRWVYFQRDTKQQLCALLYKPEPISRTKELRESRYGKKIEFIPTRINNVMLYVSTLETHCFDCELPCSSDFTGGLEMRGEDLQDGFRTKIDAPYRKTY